MTGHNHEALPRMTNHLGNRVPDKLILIQDRLQYLHTNLINDKAQDQIDFAHNEIDFEHNEIHCAHNETYCVHNEMHCAHKEIHYEITKYLCT